MTEKELMKMNLESYRQGIEDMKNVLNELFENTLKDINEKLKLMEQ